MYTKAKPGVVFPSLKRNELDQVLFSFFYKASGSCRIKNIEKTIPYQKRKIQKSAFAPVTKTFDLIISTKRCI